jgi:hypothetical protein
MVWERELVMNDGRVDPGAPVVKGAPYCADVSNETTEWLMEPGGASGNKIVKKTTSQMCRDSEGRTRQERDDAGRKKVYLHDPLTREHWVLDPAEKTAHKTAATMLFGERMREWVKDISGSAREEVAIESGHPALSGAEPVTITRNETVSPDGKRKEVEVRVIRRGGADTSAIALPPLTPPPGIQMQVNRMASRGPGVVIALQAKDMEGVKVNGERTTWTIEAGKIGNEKPIIQTREVWTSPELMLTVYSRDFDPRQGETVYRLTNLKRGEPQAALFRVPVGYVVKEMPFPPKVPAVPKAPPVPPAPVAPAARS